ncbi:MAG: aspartate aminotransferase family protein, partial [Candidatus Eisenbacteria bacterium]|nr:aspartate aminotransferase family protein [Candidatus Eisenbacteria bacterium]
MDQQEFRTTGHQLVDWIADYLEHAERYPVLAQVAPGEIRARLPAAAPEDGEPLERILRDFQQIILPGVTHWNHPRFFAYFPANNSGPSILGEMLSAALGINGMLWQTCPAATELEEQVMEWLRKLLELPEGFRGVIQDTASTSTIVALICARERLTDHAVGQRGVAAGAGDAPLRIYTSTEGHSSVEKGAKLLGFGAEHVVPIAVDDALAMDPIALRRQIAADRTHGRRPCAIVATVGTTSSTALDPLEPIGRIAAQERIWLHVDAALAGSAAILPERRAILAGIERADSFVFNPHKWLFTNFDCSAYFTRDVETLTRAMAITPEYLKTARDAEVTNFRDWGIPLGRRFRALKLWFVLRSFGAEGLRARLREHLRLADLFRQWVDQSEQFERLAPVPLNTICFRFRPPAASAAPPTEAELERLNQTLMTRVNASGRVYLTHTRLRERFALR